jgi:hypothetical protein
VSCRWLNTVGPHGSCANNYGTSLYVRVSEILPKAASNLILVPHSLSFSGKFGQLPCLKNAAPTNLTRDGPPSEHSGAVGGNAVEGFQSCSSIKHCIFNAYVSSHTVPFPALTPFPSSPSPAHPKPHTERAHVPGGKGDPIP